MHVQNTVLSEARHITARTAAAQNHLPVHENKSFRTEGNPHLSLEENLRNKLIGLGMLDSNGILLWNLPPPPKLSSKQISEMNHLLQDQDQDVHAIDNMGRAIYRLSQQKFHIVQHKKMAKANLHPKETYLCGDWAEYIIDPVSCFVDAVRTFLREKGYQEDLLDPELNALQMRPKIKPTTILWEDRIDHKMDSNAIDYLKRVHLDWIDQERYYHTEPVEHCFLDLQCEQGYFEFALGDLTGKNSLITRKRVGNAHAPFTFDQLSIPVGSLIDGLPKDIYPVADNFHQAIIDKTLKVLRPSTQRTLLPWAGSATYLANGYSFAHLEDSIRNCRGAMDTEEAMWRLHNVCRFQQGASTAVAFAASDEAQDIQEIWSQSVINENSKFLTELRHLIVEKQIPFETVRALLCFACWLRVCHPSKEWADQTSSSVCILPRGHQVSFLLEVDSFCFHIPASPITFSTLLREFEHLDSLSNLWQLLVPSRVNSDHNKKALIEVIGNHPIVEDFIKVSNTLVAHQNSFLNHIGYSCALAAHGFYERPRGLDITFKKLPLLLPDDLDAAQQELLFITSLLTPGIALDLPQEDGIDASLRRFIQYLFTNKQRFYGKALLEYQLRFRPSQDNDLFLFHVLMSQYMQYSEFGLELYHSNAESLSNMGKTEFFLGMIATPPNPTLMPKILQIGLSLNVWPNNDEERQKRFHLFIAYAAKLGFHEQCQALLTRVMATEFLNNSYWDKTASSFCSCLLEDEKQGVIAVHNAWEVLSKRNFTKPKCLDTQPRASAWVKKESAATNATVTAPSTPPTPKTARSPSPPRAIVDQVVAPVPQTTAKNSPPETPPTPKATRATSPRANEKKPASPSETTPTPKAARSTSPRANDNKASSEKPDTTAKIAPSIQAASKKKSKRKAKATAVKAAGKSTLEFSETALRNLPYWQQIEAIHNGHCNGVEEAVRKEMMTHAIQAVITDGKDLLSLFSKYHFSNENCCLTDVLATIEECFKKPAPRDQEIAHFKMLLALLETPTLSNGSFERLFSLLQEAMLSCFKNPLPSGQEIVHFQELTALLQSRCFTTNNAKCFFALLTEKLSTLPSQAEHNSKVLSGKDKASLDLLEAMLQAKQPEAVAFLQTIWSQRCAAKIQEVLKNHESNFISSLVDQRLFDEAFAFLKLLETYKVPCPKSVAQNKLKILFKECHQPCETTFPVLKFIITSRLHSSENAIPLLYLYMPSIAADEKKFGECKEMLLKCLNNLNEQAVSKYYDPIINAFGDAKADAFQFLCSLRNKNLPAVIKLAFERLFPSLPISVALKLLKPYRDALKPDATALWKAFDSLMLHYANAQGEISDIFEFLKTFKHWPMDLLEKIRSLREHEQAVIFESVYMLVKSEEYSFAAEHQQAYCQSILESMLEKPSEALLELLGIISLWDRLLPQENLSTLTFKYISSCLGFIMDPQNQAHTLRRIAILRLMVRTELPSVALDKLLLEKLASTNDPNCLDNALLLSVMRFKHPSAKEYAQDFHSIISQQVLDLPKVTDVIKVVCFCKMLYANFPGQFEKQAQSHLFERMSTLYSDVGNKKLDGEELVVAMFRAVLATSDFPALDLCSHYLTHFCHDFDKKTVRLLGLMIIHTSLQQMSALKKPKRIVAPINLLIDFLSQQPTYNEAERTEAESQLLDESIGFACGRLASLTALLQKLREEKANDGTIEKQAKQLIKLFEEKSQKLFDCFSVLGKDSPDQQNYTITLIDKLLLVVPLNEFTISHIKSYFNRIKVLDKRIQDKFGKTTEFLCNLTLQLFPKDDYSIYLTVYLILNSLNTDKLLSEHLERYFAIFQSIITAYKPRNRTPITKEQIQAFEQVLQFLLPKQGYPAFKQAHTLLKRVLPFWPQRLKDKISHFYQQLYSKLASLEFSDIQEIMKEATTTLANEPATSLNDVHISSFFKYGVEGIATAHPQNQENLLLAMVPFLDSLLKNKCFFEPKILSIPLNVLKPLSLQRIRAQIIDGGKGYDHILKLFESFETKPYLHVDDAIECIFAFINGYLSDFMNLEFSQPEQDAIVREHVSEVLTKTLTSLIHLVERNTFDKLQLLYVRLVNSLTPCNLEFLNRTLAQGIGAHDFVTSALFSPQVISRPAFKEILFIKEQMQVAVSFLFQLNNTKHEFITSHLYIFLHKMKDMLQDHLKTGVYNKSFEEYLEMVKLLVPANREMVKSQVESGKEPTDIISELLFTGHANASKFMQVADLTKKLAISNEFATALLNTDQSKLVNLARERIHANTVLLTDRFDKGFFEDKFKFYISCVSNFVSCNLALIKTQIRQKEEPLVNLVFSMLFDSKFTDSKLSEPESLDLKLIVACIWVKDLLSQKDDAIIKMGLKSNNQLITMILDTASRVKSYSPRLLSCVNRVMPLMNLIIALDENSAVENMELMKGFGEILKLLFGTKFFNPERAKLPQLQEKLATSIPLLSLISKISDFSEMAKGISEELVAVLKVAAAKSTAQDLPTILSCLTSLIPVQVDLVQASLQQGPIETTFLTTIRNVLQGVQAPQMSTFEMLERILSVSALYVKGILELDSESSIQFALGLNATLILNIRLAAMQCSSPSDCLNLLAGFKHLLPIHVDATVKDLESKTPPQGFLQIVEQIFNDMTKVSLPEIALLEQKLSIFALYIAGVLQRNDSDESLSFARDINKVLIASIQDAARRLMSQEEVTALHSCLRYLVPINACLTLKALKHGQREPHFMSVLERIFKGVCNTNFSEAALLDKKISLASAFIGMLLKEAPEISASFCEHIKDELIEQIRHASYASHEELAHLLSCIRSLVPVNALLTGHKLKTDQSSTDFITATMSELMNKEDVNRIALLQQETEVIAHYAEELIALDVEEGVKAGQTILSDYTSGLASLLMGNVFDAIPEVYLGCVNAFIPPNIALLKKQAKKGEPKQDFVSNLLINEIACEPHFMVLPFLRQKFHLANRFIESLLEINHSSTIKKADDIFGQLLELLSDVIKAEKFKGHHPEEFLECVKGFIPNAVTLQRLVPTKELQKTFPLFQLCKEVIGYQPEMKEEYVKEILKMTLHFASSFSKSKEDFMESIAYINGSAKLLRKHLKGGTFKDDFGAYLDCARLFVEPYTSLIKGSQVAMIADDIYPLLLKDTIPFKELHGPDLIKKRLAICSELIEQLVNIGLNPYVQMADKIMDETCKHLTTLLENAVFDKNLPLYLGCIESLIPCNVALLRVQFKTMRVVSDHLSRLIFIDLKLPKFKAYGLQKKKVAQKYADALDEWDLAYAKTIEKSIKTL